MDRDTAATWIEASERPMIWAAMLAVVLYLADLSGVWTTLAISDVAHGVTLCIDVLFVVDLGLKIAVLRTSYLRTPWFLVDLMCTLPVLSTLSLAPRFLRALRFVRTIRVLRTLRMMRVLRTLRVLRVLDAHALETPETRVWHRALAIAVLVYAAVFVGLVQWARRPGIDGRIHAIDDRPVGRMLTLVVERPDGRLVREVVPLARLLPHADHAELMLVAGSLVSIGLMLVLMRFRIPSLWSRQMATLLNVALPRPVAQWLMDHPDDYDHTVRMPASVIFCDIRGFTTQVGDLDLETLKSHLERVMTVIVEAHRSRGLIIDKFIGDAVMSFRGGDIAGGTPEEIAWRVVRAALDSLRAVRDLDDPYFNSVKVGGASSPHALIGAFGTSHRLSYTILGDKVNLAARLEGACNALGVDNLFDQDTRALLADRSDIAWRAIGRVTIEGRADPEHVWEAFDAREDVEWIDAFHAALELLRAGDVRSAQHAFESFLVTHPNDGPARLYASLCHELPEERTTETQPVLDLRKRDEPPSTTRASLPTE